MGHKMVEEYECFIGAGLDDFYNDERDNEPISPDEDLTFFDYSWEEANPAYQAKLENPPILITESL
jgi:hypothetical protein